MYQVDSETRHKSQETRLSQYQVVSILPAAGRQVSRREKNFVYTLYLVLRTIILFS